jgi:hypothetical protein
MKRTLEPSWTAEEIAAGKRFKEGWLKFFGSLGPTARVVPLGLDAEAGTRASILAKHEAQLLAYPNVVGVTEGTRMRRGKPTNEPVIVVLVSRKVPRKNLTKASLIPSHTDGVPIDVVEVGPIEALESNPKKSRKASNAWQAGRKRMRRG